MSTAAPHNIVAQANEPTYAEVAVPLHVSQTFVYRLQPWMRTDAQVGSRILVPLGRSRVAGFIVALHETLEAEKQVAESDIKEAEDILDPVPICTKEVLEITRWVSDYYASPWGEVIKAALPPGIQPDIRVVLSLTEQGINELSEASQLTPTMGNRVLSLIAERDELAIEELSSLGTKAQVGKALRELEQRGSIKRAARPCESTVRGKLQRAVRLTDHQTDASRITEAQRRVIEALRNEQAMALKTLLTTSGVSTSVVNKLAQKGVIEIFDRLVRRDPLAEAELPDVQNYQLTHHQFTVLAEIEQQLQKSSYGAFLLHGVTGSGKTEIYIRAMQASLNMGRTAMMLVPEIALTPVFSRRLRAEFGDQVAIFHSSLPKGERFDEWMRVKNGEARVVIGTRSAVFAPISNLGLVIVDEEHESTYRQQDSPYYNARDTAIVRAQKESATVVLGSATPSLETFHNARTGKYQYLSLPDRIGNRPMAEARIIDMRDVFSRQGKPRVFSDELLAAIKETHQNKEQSIILLNRRGFASFILCRSCGETIQCPNCDVTLTYHRSDRVIVCHYCNHREPAPSKCPSCSKQYIFYVGEGTEQIEALLKEAFPELKMARIDRDTTARRNRFEKALLDFGAGRLDMLVGTQMLAKGHDFPNVTLVGVVSVDAGLGLPDFRAAERTFQLITQVAGRAGRGERRGRVLVQTYHPEHYALQHACAQDYHAFYKQEIRYRENHLYPPFVAIALLLLHGTDLKRLQGDAMELRKELDLANKDRTCRVLGPAQAPLARLKGEHRIQLLIKSRNRRQLRAVVDSAISSMIGRGLNPRSVNLEIDPVSIM